MMPSVLCVVMMLIAKTCAEGEGMMPEGEGLVPEGEGVAGGSNFCVSAGLEVLA